MKMENIFNFRELGGIPVGGGRHVKHGVFFRSSLLDEASENDIKTLNSLGIKVIVDFRDESEIICPETFQKLTAKHLSVPVFTKDATLAQMRKKSDSSKAFSVSEADFAQLYRAMPFANDSYKTLFSLIKDGETPLVFNCSAGKDRTGIAAALILTLLGADKETVIADYLKTAVHEKIIAEKLVSRMNFLMRRFVQKRMSAVFKSERCYIEASFDAITDKYGNFPAYFLAEYGLTASDIETLKATYTE